jgi:hypothetical protein
MEATLAVSANELMFLFLFPQFLAQILPPGYFLLEYHFRREVTIVFMSNSLRLNVNMIVI